MSLSAAQQAARLLAERPEHDWRLDELAALRETDLPIAEAMSTVGWRSRGHAARHFKEVFGVSPSGYRKIGQERIRHK